MSDVTKTDLTERERTVLGLLSTPRTYQEIADELYLSLNTVKSHVAHLYMKLGATTRRNALRQARALDLLASATDPDGTRDPNGVTGRRERAANRIPHAVYLLWQSEGGGELLLGVYSSPRRARHVLAHIYDHQPFVEHRPRFRITACRVDPHREGTDAELVQYEHPLAKESD